MKKKLIRKILIYTLLIIGIVIFILGFFRAVKLGDQINKESAQKNQTKIIFWHAMGGPLGKVLDGMIDEFNKTHPDIYIVPQSMGNYNALSQKLLASAIAKNQPVLAQAYEAWIAKFVEGNLLVPFNKFITNVQDFKKDFYPVIFEDNVYKGKLYSLPFNKSTPILYYNKDLFKKSGLSTVPPQTWDDFLVYSQRINQKNPKKLGYVGAGTVSDFECFLVQHGGKLLSDDGKTILFNSKEGAEALQFLLDMKYLHHVADYYIGGGFQFQTDFITGRAGMMIGSSVSRIYIEKHLMFNWGMGPLLRGKNKGVLIYGTNIVLFKNATEKQQRAAWKFVKWFLSPKNQAKWAAQTGYLPARISSLKTKEFQKTIKHYPGLKQIILGLKDGFVDPRTAVWFIARQNLEQAIGNVFLSDKIISAYKQYNSSLASDTKNSKLKKQLNSTVQSIIKEELGKAAKKTQKWLE